MPSTSYTAPTNVDGNIQTFTGDTSAITVTVLDANGGAVDISAKTLQVVIEDKSFRDIETIADGAITKSTNTARFSPAAATVAREAVYSYALRDTSNGQVFAKGDLIISRAAMSGQ